MAWLDPAKVRRLEFQKESFDEAMKLLDSDLKWLGATEHIREMERTIKQQKAELTRIHDTLQDFKQLLR